MAVINRIFAKLLLAFLASQPQRALADFHLVDWSQLIGDQDSPDFFSAAVHNFACGDVENAHVADSTDSNDPLPDDSYPWWTTEFRADTCDQQLDFLQQGNGNFLVYGVDTHEFYGQCTKGSQKLINCFDIITSITARDDYVCHCDPSTGCGVSVNVLDKSFIVRS